MPQTACPFLFYTGTATHFCWLSARLDKKTNGYINNKPTATW